MSDDDKKDDLDAIDRVKNMELQEKEMREGVWKEGLEAVENAHRHGLLAFTQLQYMTFAKSVTELDISQFKSQQEYAATIEDMFFTFAAPVDTKLQ